MDSIRRLIVMAGCATLLGCDVAPSLMLARWRGHEEAAADLYRRHRLGEPGVLQLLEDRAPRSAFAAFFAGLAWDRGVEPRGGDDARAGRWYALGQALPRAAFNRALVVLRADDASAARALLEPLAQQGEPRARQTLAAVLESLEPAGAMFWYERILADGRNPWAEARLARLYLRNDIRRRNVEQARRLLLMSAEAGRLENVVPLAELSDEPVQQARWLAVAQRAGMGAPTALTARVDKRSALWRDAQEWAALWLYAHSARSQPDLHLIPYTEAS